MIGRGRRGKSSRKALVLVSSSRPGAHNYSFKGYESPSDGVQSGSSLYWDSENEECMLGAHGKDARGKGRRNFVRNSKSKGERRSATHEVSIRCFRSDGKWHFANVCPTPSPPADRSKRELVRYSCGKSGDMQAEWQQMVARRTEPNSTAAAPIQTPRQGNLPYPIHKQQAHEAMFTRKDLRF